MATAWMIVRSDYTTLNLPLELEVTATPGSSIEWQFDSGDGGPIVVTSGGDRWNGWEPGDPLPPPPTFTGGGHVGSWFEAWTDLVTVSVAMVQNNYLAAGCKLVELSFDNPADISMSQPPAALGEPFDDHGGFPLKRADVIAEVSEADIRAAAATVI